MITSTFIQGNSFLHKTDPRLKTIILLCTVILFFLPLSITAIFIFFTGLVLIGIYSLGFLKALQPVKMILPIIIFVIILTPLFFRGGETILIINNIIILTSEGLFHTLRLILRFTGITVSFYIFFSTTSISNFILTLEWFRLPYKAALIITIALRYIPSMIIIYNNIQEAHSLRVNSSKNKILFWKKLNKIFPTLVSVLIHSVKSIPALSMALELRGIGKLEKRSQFKCIKSSNMVLQITITGVITVLIILCALRSQL
ncbi:MAG: energy-coupling factor transporter transmembrane component T [Campylobacterota bacterium]|nr:energy-coupling factor transporter transmembrane component T [Campylobacterota bacterium]